MIKKWNLFLPLILFLTACAPSALSIKPEDKSRINTIAILQIEEPQLRMLNLGSGMAAMGAIGGALIAEGDDSERLYKLLNSKSFSFQNQLTNDLQRQLIKAGYKTIVVKVPRKDTRELLDDYSKLEIKDADAVLDVVVTNYGYVTEHFMFSPQWRPEARAYIALAKPGNNKVIYKNTVLYGYHNAFMSGVELDAPKIFHFDEQEDVFNAGAPKIISGLKDASQKIAQNVSDALKK